MKRWVYANLEREAEVLAEVRSWILSRPDIAESKITWHYFTDKQLQSWLPLMCSQVESKLSRVVAGAAIVKSIMEELPIHNDNMPNTHARLLIPVLNTEGSHTVFYESTATPVKNFCDDDYSFFYEFDPADCKEVSRVELIRPIILRINKPHKIELGPMQQLPRISLTLKLERDPVSRLYS